MKIAVVCGGLSNERDVSITSGTCVARALRERGHKVVLVDLYYGYNETYDDPPNCLSVSRRTLSIPSRRKLRI